MPRRWSARPTWVSLRRSGLAPDVGSIDGPARPVGVEGHGEAVRLEDGAQGGHDGRHRFAAGDQLGIEQPFGRIVDDRQQGGTAVGDQREPHMTAAVEMQQFAETGARLAAAAVAAAGAVFGEQPGLLQEAFNKRVAQRDGVLAPRELVEMALIEATVPFAIQA